MEKSQLWRIHHGPAFLKGPSEAFTLEFIWQKSESQTPILCPLSNLPSALPNLSRGVPGQSTGGETSTEEEEAVAEACVELSLSSGK